jgi:(S)-mandelate dehydrogenase
VAQALNIDALQALAHRRVPRFAMDYMESGADGEATLRHNRAVFDRVQWVPRTLVDTTQRSTTITLLGRPGASPLVVAPTGLNGIFRKGADLMIARAAARAGIPSALSTVSNETLEDVSGASRQLGGRPWFQLYMLKDREISENLMERARACGVDTLVLTSDAAVFGHRERDLRNFSDPMTLSWKARLNVLRHPAWLWDVMVPGGAPRFANLLPYLPPRHHGWRASAAFIAQQMDPSVNWSDVAWLRARWSGKLVIKGISSTADAVRAQGEGADGIVLSNHGGRQLDGAVSPMDELPAVRRAVGPDFCLLVDSGFRRGTDIVKAMALGASAVMLGRPVLYGVAAGGESGVFKGLELLRTEIDRTMGQLGVCSFADLTPDMWRFDTAR